MRIALVMMMLVGCADTGSSADESALLGCPDPTTAFPDDCRMSVEIGDVCDYDAMGSALGGSCECSGTGFWVCNSCPFSWTPVSPLDPCTPNSTCEINSWEHGCSCGCTAEGTWACSPDTINSRCPE